MRDVYSKLIYPAALISHHTTHGHILRRQVVAMASAPIIFVFIVMDHCGFFVIRKTADTRQ